MVRFKLGLKIFNGRGLCQNPVPLCSNWTNSQGWVEDSLASVEQREWTQGIRRLQNVLLQSFITHWIKTRSSYKHQAFREEAWSLQKVSESTLSTARLCRAAVAGMHPPQLGRRGTRLSWGSSCTCSEAQCEQQQNVSYTHTPRE